MIYKAFVAQFKHQRTIFAISKQNTKEREIMVKPVLPIKSKLPVKKTTVVANTMTQEAPTLSERATKTRLSKAQKATLAMRKLPWPHVTDKHLWLRNDRNGFTTIPRTMPLFMEMIADASKQVASGKSIPAGKTYLVLWSRVFDEGVVRIDVEAAAAMEAGYTGERNVTTWREHLRVLKDLGFIDFNAGSAGPCQFVLLFNPCHAAKALRAKKWVQEATYTVLFLRAQEIGATDLSDPDL